MLEKLLPYELDLFYLINSSHTPLMDQIMRVYSGIYIWFPVMIGFLFVLTYQKKRYEWIPVFIAFTGVVVAGLILSSLITKPYFARFRPIYHPSVMDQVRSLYESMPDLYGFISGHSTTAFGIATFTACLFGKRFYTWTIFIWAFMMAYSRIYLGVHFISDIVAGAFAGLLIGFIGYRLYLSFANKREVKAEYSTKIITVFSLSLIGYILFCALISNELVRWFGYF
ncbi:phosphatase PAP2 family protein [Parabacteroides sp. PF5-9]|uniref:phosphatase PAP2 family protein n=1 Tax=Parabacteroides sp. PF5-9 TaxID=1742404 RepID=UPI0024771A98|nr:phosphatase PAP2 family protein [Parabacteroides sp. PF5-9]MDH6356521.1 undecaprenyl-diphosphatase [Parabacteroides sp. PF5-9]